MAKSALVLQPVDLAFLRANIAGRQPGFEFRGDSTGRHIQRMCRYCELLARKAGLPQKTCELYLSASPLHDVGKFGTPDSILLKPGKLTEEEFEIIKKHTEIGRQILDGSESEFLMTSCVFAWTHHERWNGTGYPRGLAGHKIPLEGRICAIADVFDALSTKRVYKPAYAIEQCIQIMKEGRATQFDPELLDLFLDSLSEVMRINGEFPDRLRG